MQLSKKILKPIISVGLLLIPIVLYYYIFQSNPKEVKLSQEQQLLSIEILNETEQTKAERMAWWKDARFGMFIHWGLYAVPAGSYGDYNTYGEWIMREAKISVPEYKKYANKFDPVEFDAKKWVKMAKDAGMTYLVFTTKHHEGFCMYDSDFTDYDMVDATPYGKDVVKMVSEACREAGITFGTYYSVWDWYHPDAVKENYITYNKIYMKPQIVEILNKYDPKIMWFDFGRSSIGKDIITTIRKLKPKIIINNRGGWQGDFDTPEQSIPTIPTTEYWETCMTMNNTWGYNKIDKDFKPAEDLIWKLVDINSKGGNFLLNVGPDGKGNFPEESIHILGRFGDWMAINREVIFNSACWKKNPLEQNIRYSTSKTEQNTYYAICRLTDQKTINFKQILPRKGSEIFLLGYQYPVDWQIDPVQGTIIKIPPDLEVIEEGILCFKIEGNPAPVTEIPEINMDQEKLKNVDHNIFINETSISMSCADSGASIFYTLDGTNPTSVFTKYIQPVPIRETTTIKAFSVSAGKFCSPIIFKEFRKPQYPMDSPDYLIGQWQDASKQITVTFYKENNIYFGKITNVWDNDPHYKNKIIAQNFKFKNGKWINGEIFDPMEQKSYRCEMTLIAKDLINVHGYIGLSILGRSEIWTRVE